ncbi:hypothetical protein SSX86_032278 [Deinandra increscens subsp. villosa]|uniref:Uncharacterized protein n=1 Tax=Deinandra increscens subsp. villosa TaxID=3103831 RepID=A0AAP0C7L9_9ASTR
MAKISVKSYSFVVGVLVLLMTMSSSDVECRTLYSTPSKSKTGGDSSIGISTKWGKTSCGGLRVRMRELAYKLASGPSKRGPGH